MEKADTQKEQSKHSKNHRQDHVQMHPEVRQADDKMQCPRRDFTVMILRVFK